MKSLKDILTEALVKQNVDNLSPEEEFAELWSYVKYEDLVEAIDKSFEKAKYTFSKDKAVAPSQILRYESDRYVEYTLIFGHKEGKGRMDDGARLGMNLIINKNKDERVLVYLKLSWSNGKHSYSIYSNVAQSKRCEIDFGKKASHTLLVNSVGGHDYYSCLPEVADAIVDGIHNLAWYKSDFEDAMKKARFTDVQWNKLVDTFNDLFRIKKHYGMDKFPWNSVEK